MGPGATSRMERVGPGDGSADNAIWRWARPAEMPPISSAGPFVKLGITWTARILRRPKGASTG